MRRALLILWTVLAGAAVTIALLAQFWIAQRADSSQERVRVILSDRLSPFNDLIGSRVEGYSLDLQQQFDRWDVGQPADCAEMKRDPLVGELVVIDSSGRLLFPVRNGDLSSDRQGRVDEARQLLIEMLDPRPKTNAMQQQASQKVALPSPILAPQLQQEGAFQSVLSNQPAKEDQLLESEDSGWITWYHRRNMELGFWWRAPDDSTFAMAVLPAARWMADIVAELPDADPPPAKDNRGKTDGVFDGNSLGQIVTQLVDVEGEIIYQWGSVSIADFAEMTDGRPDAELEVVEPFEGWRLRSFASDETSSALAGDSLQLPLWLAVIGVTLALFMGGVVATIALGRQFRLAQSRVSFVNQVSHELRTPLTNIRMYADLVSESLQRQDALEEASVSSELEKVDVIRSESQRLSRLITNVLQFAKDSRAQSAGEREALRKRACNINELVEEVTDTFIPRLREDGIELELQLAETSIRLADCDAVEQILVNLIGNAEKYGRQGKRIVVSSRFDGQDAILGVQDYGPGVPKSLRGKLFDAFVRGSDRLKDPAGTGIGLTITRSLARRHGGDCYLVDSQVGAAFECRLLAPELESEA